MWIPVDIDLPEHPKSLRLAELLKDPLAWAHVVLLWRWAMKYARDGNLSPFSPGQIALACGYDIDGDHVLSALKNCGGNGKSGFIDENGCLHDWDKHVGQQLKAREQVRRRVKRFRRNANVTRHEALRNRYVTRSPDLTVPDLTVPKDQHHTPLPPAPENGAGRQPSQETALFHEPQTPRARHVKPAGNRLTDPPGFEEFWTSYPQKRRVRKRVCLKLWRERKLEAQAEKILTRLLIWTGSADWQKQDGKYIPAAPKFLKEWRWEDQPETASSESTYERTLRELG